MAKFISSNCEVAILSSGAELVEGGIGDSNSYFLAKKLTNLGFVVSLIKYIGDNELTQEQIKVFTSEYFLVIIIGVLDFTITDIKPKGCAKNANQINKKQAIASKGFSLINDAAGRDSGFFIKTKDCFIVSLPAGALELQKSWKTIEPILIHQFGIAAPTHLSATLWFITEVQIDSLLRKWSIGLDVHWRTQAGVACVIVYFRGNQAIKFYNIVQDNIGPLLFLKDSSTALQRVVELLISKQISLAGAESCTGGMVSSLLVNSPGISDYFRGAVVSYANCIKRNILHVSKETLDQHGAVSPECVIEMIKGVFSQFNSELGYAITGVAGPSGGNKENPVGTVYIAVGLKDQIVCRRFLFQGDRLSIRSKTAEATLFLLDKLISSPKTIDIASNWEYSDIVKS